MALSAPVVRPIEELETEEERRLRERRLFSGQPLLSTSPPAPTLPPGYAPTPGWYDPTGRFKTEAEYVNYQLGLANQPQAAEEVLARALWLPYQAAEPIVRHAPTFVRAGLEQTTPALVAKALATKASPQAEAAGPLVPSLVPPGYKPGTLEQLASGGVSIAADPLTYLLGLGAGKVGAAVAPRVAGRALAPVGVKLTAGGLARAALPRMARGAAFFGGYEAVQSPLRQLIESGEITIPKTLQDIVVGIGTGTVFGGLETAVAEIGLPAVKAALSKGGGKVMDYIGRQVMTEGTQEFGEAFTKRAAVIQKEFTAGRISKTKAVQRTVQALNELRGGPAKVETAGERLRRLATATRGGAGPEEIAKDFEKLAIEHEKLTERLADVSAKIEARQATGIVRPKWAAGWNDEDLLRIARKMHLNPYRTDWGDAVDALSRREFVRLPVGKETITGLKAEESIIKRRLAAISKEGDALIAGEEAVPQAISQPTTAMQAGMGIGEKPPQGQLFAEYGKGAAGPQAPLIQPEPLAARAAREAELARGQQVLPKAMEAGEQAAKAVRFQPLKPIEIPNEVAKRDFWNRTPFPQRRIIAEQSGLPARTGDFPWEALPDRDKRALNMPAAEVPPIPPTKPPTAIPENPVAKLRRLVRVAKPARKETEILKHQEMQRRVAKVAAAMETKTGERAFIQAKGALKGELPKAAFEPVMPEMTKDDLFALREQIRTSSLQPLQKVTTEDAFVKLLNGAIPTRGELQLLEEVYGADLIRDILSKRKLGLKAFDAFLDAIGLFKANVASADVSAPGRQGVMLIGQKEWWTSWKPMLKSMLSEKNMLTVDAAIKSHPDYAILSESPLYIAPLPGRNVAGQLSGMEESFMSKVANKLPWVKWSNRAYVTYLNELRSSTLYHEIAKWRATEGLIGSALQVRTNKLASAINAMTGRGELGALGRGELPAILNAGFFSPRFIASRFQAPMSLFSSDPVIRKFTFRNLATFVGAGLGILTLAKLAGADVEADPRSTEFGKVKWGNLRWDVWAGYSPLARYAAQFITASRKTSTGRIQPLKRSESLSRFVQSKLSPAASLVLDALRDANFLGEPLELSEEGAWKEVRNRLLPISLQDMIEGFQEEGLLGATLATSGLTGVGFLAYESVAFDLTAKRNELAQQGYGLPWEQLTPAQQTNVTKTSPELQELELAYEQNKTGIFSEEAQQQQLQAGEKVQGMLSKDLQKEIKLAGESVGPLSRTLTIPGAGGQTYYLNDERFAALQEATAKAINELAQKAMGTAGWKKATQEQKAAVLGQVISDGRARARAEILKGVSGTAPKGQAVTPIVPSKTSPVPNWLLEAAGIK